MASSSPKLPSMRKRMTKRAQSLYTSVFPAFSDEFSPAMAANSAKDQTLREQRSISSFATSSVSNESLSTDYGLHRALNSLVVPNEQNPIATIKDRKNANYLERVNETEQLLRIDLDDAIAAYDEAVAKRDFSNDPKLEALRNREYYDAILTITCCSREYTVFQEDLNELRDMPKLKRSEMKRFFTDVKAQERLDRADDNDSTLREKLRQTRREIEGLRGERHDIQKRANAVESLSEHVAYQAHLLTHYTNNNEKLKEHTQYVEHLYGSVTQEYAGACESFGRHYRHIDQLHEDLKEQITAVTYENEALQQSLDQQSKDYATLMQYSGQVKNENAGLQGAVNGLKSEITGFKRDDQGYKRNVNELERDLCGLRLNIDSLQQDNDELQRDNVELKEELDFSRDFANKLSGRLHDAHTEFKLVSGQLSRAKAIAMQRKDYADKQRIAQTNLHEALEAANAQMEQMKLHNDNLMRTQAYHQDRLAEMRETNAHLREEFNDLLRSADGSERNGRNVASTGVDGASRHDTLKGWSSV